MKARFSDMVGVVEWLELNNWVMLLPDLCRVYRVVDLSVMVMRTSSSEGLNLVACKPQHQCHPLLKSS